MEEIGDKSSTFTARLSGGKPWGFTVKETTLDESKPQMYLEISKIDPKGRAADHLRLGDVLLAIDGVPCKNVEDAKTLMLGTGFQDKLSLTLCRRNKAPPAAETAKANLTDENTSSSADQHCQNFSPVECDSLVNSSDCDNSGNITEVNDESDLQTTNVTMEVGPETKQPKSAILYSSIGQRGSSSTLQPTTFPSQQTYRSPDEGYSNRAYMSAVPSSRFARHSMDYQTCGLPSGTLFRKPTGKRTSFAEPLVTVPTNRSSDPNRGRKGSVPTERIGARIAPTIVPNSSRISSVRSQDIPSMMGSSKDPNFPSNGYIYRATPVVPQSSWSQTESSAMISQPSSYNPPTLHENPMQTDVIKLSGVLRGAPSLSTSHSPCHNNSSNLRYDSGDTGKDSWDSECSSSSGIISSRSSISSGASAVASSYDQVPSHRLKGRKSLTNTSSSSDELDDYASLAKRRGSESAVVMPARPQLSSSSDDFGRNNNLTTIKEVRTYQIRPNDNGLKTSSLHINTGSSSGHSSSSSSTPDECKHKRDVSLDSSVSWQSNSTNSSGYSSVAMSSSTPTLEINGSEETLVPPNYMDFRERSNTTDPMQISSVEQSEAEDQDVKPYRSVSVSEMVRSYSETKLAPTVPPKPRYAFLPAQSPDASSQKRSVTSASPLDKVVKRPSNGYAQTSPPVPPKNVDFSGGEKLSLHHIPVYVEEPIKETIRRNSVESAAGQPLRVEREPEAPVIRKPQLQRPSPVLFRTGVHGLVLGSQKTSVISELEEPVVPDFNEHLQHEKVHAPQETLTVNHSPKRNEIHGQQSGMFSKTSTNELDLNNTKNELISRLTAKISLLKEEQSHIRQEIDQNDAIGDEIYAGLKEVADESDLEKYSHHLKELEEMVALTTSIKNRLSLVEASLAQLVLPENDLELCTLQTKKKKLASQLDEVLYLNSGIERRRNALRIVLSEKYMGEEDYAEYMDFFTTKTNLLHDSRNMVHKLKLAEEQLICLQSTGSSA